MDLAKKMSREARIDQLFKYTRALGLDLTRPMVIKYAKAIGVRVTPKMKKKFDVENKLIEAQLRRFNMKFKRREARRKKG